MIPPASHASQQVERIREILIGRQMQSVEQRLDRLEARLSPMPVEAAEAAWIRDLESLQQECRESKLRVHEAIAAERLRQQQESQRLAQQIETIARQRRELTDEGLRLIKTRLAPGFDRWQHQLFGQLQQRESHLVAQLRDELDRLRAWVHKELSSRSDSSTLHQAVAQLAASVRQLAERLPPPSFHSPPR